MMLQQETPDDYVLATNKQYSVRQFVALSFELVDVIIEWRGEGVSEVGVDKATNKVLVEISPKYFRPTEVETLLGDPAKAKKQIGWEPETSFKQLIIEMMEYDMKQNGLEMPEGVAAIRDRQDEYC